jgi:RNA polymerase sigma factor (sigma-70 family)
VGGGHLTRGRGRAKTSHGGVRVVLTVGFFVSTARTRPAVLAETTASPPNHLLSHTPISVFFWCRAKKWKIIGSCNSSSFMRSRGRQGRGVSEGIDSSGETRLDSEAVAEIYRRHADDLRAYLLGLLHDHDLAAEVLQETFVKVAQSGHAAADGSLRSWLFRVAYHEAIDRRRRAAVDGRAMRAAAWWKPTARGPTAGEESGESRASRAETVARVRSAIETLPAEQREVVRLRIDEEWTFARIAAATNAPLGTVLTRMRLAMQTLARVLKDESRP